MDYRELLRYIAAEARAAGSQKALAERLGFSESYVSDVLRGTRQPSGLLLEALGLIAEVRYVAKRPKGKGRQ